MFSGFQNYSAFAACTNDASGFKIIQAKLLFFAAMADRSTMKLIGEFEFKIIPRIYFIPSLSIIAIFANKKFGAVGILTFQDNFTKHSVKD